MTNVNALQKQNSFCLTVTPSHKLIVSHTECMHNKTPFTCLSKAKAVKHETWD